MHHPRMLITTMSLLAALAIGGCAGVDAADGAGSRPDPTPTSTQGGSDGSTVRTDDVAEARELWQALGVTSYEMLIDRSCFCPTAGKMRVTVEDGVVTAAAFTDAGRTEPIILEHVSTIDSLLDAVTSTVKDFDQVTVELAVKDGVPVRGSADAAMAIDEEIRWTIIEFTPQ